VIKVMVLLRRPQSWTRERFHRWWLDEHVAHGKKPNLRKYRVCLVTGSTSHKGRGTASPSSGSTTAPRSIARGRPRWAGPRWRTRARVTAIGWC